MKLPPPTVKHHKKPLGGNSFTPILLAFFILSVVLILCSCKEAKEIKERTMPEKKTQIVVRKAKVSNTGVYGYVGAGSVLFGRIDPIENGYLVQVKKGNKVLSTRYCNESGLQESIDAVKYDLDVRDSVVAEY